MAHRLRYGMVGGDVHAFIGEVHRKALNFDNRVELVAGSFSDIPEYNVETAEDYGVAEDRTYSDYKDMAAKEAARPDGIDFVSICTPNHLHYDVAKTFLENGINVVSEKPLCFEVEQAEELSRLAKDKGLLFGVTYAYPGYTMVRVMREMIRNGKIGNIVAVNAEYAQDWLLNQLTDSGGKAGLSIWRTDPKYAGISNSVADIGTHVEYTVHFVTGLKIRRLLATVNRYGHALDLNSNIIVEYDNGINGAYWISQVAAGHLNGLVVRVFGDKGSLEWQQERPDWLMYTPKDGATQELSRGCGFITEEAGKYSRLPCGHPEGLYIAFANTYKDYVTALIDVRNGQEPGPAEYPTVDDGLQGVKFVHAVIKSADEGTKWVDMD